MANKRRIQAKKRKQKLKSNLIVGGILIGVVAMIGFLVWSDIKPGIGTEIAVLRSDHVDDGEPVESPSDPPTSGSHYGNPMPAGFYTENSPEYLSTNHDGYLIHSLEHGYVVFWYNCEILDEQSCGTLLSNIQAVMDKFNGFKLIAFPRPSITVPLVMTSWGQLQEFQTFDSALAEKFIKINQPRAPEPGAS